MHEERNEIFSILFLNLLSGKEDRKFLERCWTNSKRTLPIGLLANDRRNQKEDLLLREEKFLEKQRADIYPNAR